MNHFLHITVPLALLAFASPALAQEAAEVRAPDATPPADTQPGAAGQVRETPPQVTYTPPPGFPQPGFDPNAHLPSGSRPVLGEQSDTFDFQRRTTGPVVVTGREGAPALLGRDASRTEITPTIHTVQRGDTLWGLCDRYFQNPWNWPKVWSYNPQVQNPHWIYPGDELRMSDPAVAAPAGASRYARLTPGVASTLGAPGAGALGPRAMPEDTVFLRDHGYLGDPERDVWGELVGAQEDQMLLSQGNQVYLLLRPGVEVREGQELSVFRSVRPPPSIEGARKPPGQIVTIKGRVRVNHVNPETRVARAEVLESSDVIERGAKVGPAGRSFDVVPPRVSEVNLWARLLTGIYPHVFFGQHQIVFLDRGSEDGLMPGNRLVVVRKGDTWRRGLGTATAMARERMIMESPGRAETETTPITGDEEQFPTEVVGELRVLRAEQYSSLALVTHARGEMHAGDRALARKGY